MSDETDDVATPDHVAPGFDFDANGLRVDAEDSPRPSAGEPLKVSFTVCYGGISSGSAQVVVGIDGVDSGISWTSPVLEPGECASPDGDSFRKHFDRTRVRKDSQRSDPGAPAPGSMPASPTGNPAATSDRRACRLI